MVDKRFIIREDFVVEYFIDGFINILDVCLDNIFIEKIVKYCEYIERLIVKVKIYKMFFVYIFILLLKI